MSSQLDPQSGASPPQAAVIGAGVAGLSTARALQMHGYRVEVFEKSRGLGGRTATRRLSEQAFDHGAPCIAVQHPDFRRRIAHWRECGIVDTWLPHSGRVTEGAIHRLTARQERILAVPGMNGLCHHLGRGLSIRTGVRVAALQRIAGCWYLHDQTGPLPGGYDLLVVALPAPQAEALLRVSAPRFAAQAAAICYHPAWAVMLSFADGVSPGYSEFLFDRGPLEWAGDNASKPARQGNGWVLHATADWSRAHLHDTPAEVADELASCFCGLVGLDPLTIDYRAAHRWLYATVVNPLYAGALWDPDLQLGICGDWCQGGGVEGAWLSGQALVRRLPRDPPPAARATGSTGQ